MSIYNSPYFLFKAGSLKGKTKKEIEEFFVKQKKQAKVPKKQRYISPLEKRKAKLAKQYKENNNE
jgi:hypothetical protein